jgi:hypothetical protein
MLAPTEVSLLALETPRLLLDLDRLEKNCAVMRDRCGALGIALRPHLKTAKSVDVARIDTIASKVGGHFGKRPYFDVEARLNDRSSRTLARYFVNRGDADVFAAKLWTALARK